MTAYRQFYTLAIAGVFSAIWVSNTSKLVKAEIVLDSLEITESSGVSVSFEDPGIFWTHNDSGDLPRLFAIQRSSGRLLAEVHIDGLTATDWEDICGFRLEGRSILAVADIGNNQKSRDWLSLVLIQEPRLHVDQPSTVQVSHCQPTTVLEFRFPNPVDCEALAYDPLTHGFLLITKSLVGCSVYQLPLGFENGQFIRQQQTTLLAKLAIPLVTAADISRDGRQLIIGTYGPATLITRTDNTSSWDWKHTRTIQLPNRKQGESICFDDSGKHLLLTSEGVPTPLLEVNLDD